ncbi:DeoR/GlpR family DNA-binding transcription regulator [Vaginisenegalia massiliensis]|uniref:DeoR/GlpR family DNA-binding transcription regulator n=1 Tax=Vaginisenegalia massiliensis TaxID=2058294 RepID=UPI000F549D6D|nr:DeoR/GlpR family DNA-binding transcription regulator [Vaginisenegalia massiliensis]
MFVEERRKQIVNMVNSDNSISVNELSEKFNVSLATIRSDLNILDRQNKLIRTHGGAVKIENKDQNLIISNNYEIRKNMHINEKKYIARIALEHINDEDCIILDASSTCYELAKLLNEKSLNLTVVTNGIRTANLLKKSSNITVIVIGGIIKGDSNAIEGLLGSDILNRIYVNTIFFSAFGLTKEEGFTDFNIYEIELKKKMLEAASTKIALIDSSKFNRKSLTSFAYLRDIDCVITDEGLASEVYTEFSEYIYDND